MKKVMTVAVLSCATYAAAAGGLLIAEYQLGDHPDGSQSPPPYGLRLDGILGAGVGSLSIDYYDDTVLSVYDNGGMLSINITGTLFGGLVDGSGGYLSTASYAVDFTYAIGVSDTGNGWEVNGFDAGNAGTLTNTATNDVISLYGKTNNAGLNFAFLADGDRLDNDNSSWVGRGWLTDQVDGTDPYAGQRDWLFTATLIPAPGAFALLGMGGLVAMRRRR